MNHRLPRGAGTTRPTTSTAAGRRKFSFVPAASPAVSPAQSSAPVDRPLPRPSSLVDVAAFSASATALNRKKIPTMSFRASPAWSASAGTLSAIAPSASDHGATPNGRPMHQLASRQPTSQPRFSSGDIRSREKASIPIAWTTSLFAG